MKTVVTAQLKYPSILENAPSAGQDAARAFLGGGIRPTVSLKQLPKPHGYFSSLYTYYSFLCHKVCVSLSFEKTQPFLCYLEVSL